MPRRPRAHDLREARDADAHQFAAFALLGLLAAQFVVADRLHREVECALVVPAVVLPVEDRLVGEGVRRDEVLLAHVGGVHPDLGRQHVDEPLDGVDGLGDAERAAVGDAPGRLVRVHAVDLREGVLEVVRARADREQTGRELRGVAGGVGVAVVGERFDAQRLQRAVAVGGDLGGHVVVAGERVRLQVLDAVLDPLHGVPRDDRGGDRDHVAGVDRHLAAKASTDVRRDDPDLLLGQPDVARDQRKDRADRVWRLRGHPDRELPGHRVELGDAAARLDRGDMDARQVDVLRDRHIRLLEGAVRRVAIADLPMEDVVVGLALLVVAQHGCIGLERLEWVHDHGQRLVLDLDGLDAVGGCVAAGRHDGGDLLAREHHLVDREHHLGVRHQRRHPVQVELLERLAGDHGEHALHLEGGVAVDALDAGVRVGAAHDVQVEHPRPHDVVDVVAAAADEARVLLALDAVAHASDFGACLCDHGVSPP